MRAVLPFCRLPLAFLLLAVPLGFVLAVLVPVGEVPDETAHIVRAYAVSSGQWLGHRGPAMSAAGEPIVSAGYDVDTGLFGASFASPAPGGLVTAGLVARRAATPWSHGTVFAAVPNTASYAPTLYLVSGTALALARWLDVPPALAVTGARLANMLAFAALGTLALALARRMRALLFVLLCLPSTLSLAASVNQDGLLIATVVLAVALLTRPGPASRAWAALPLAVLCLAKPPYLPLVALLVVPGSGPAGWRPLLHGTGLAIAASVPAVLWSLLALRRTVVPFSTEPYAPGPLYSGTATLLDRTDSGAQLSILLADPARSVGLLTHTARVWWHAWSNEIVGVLGQLSLVLPGWLYDAWFVAACAAAVAGMLAWRPDTGAWRPWHGATVLAGVLASTLLVFVVQYLTWTHVGADTIAGVQGRYFVPLIAAAALALPSLPILRGTAGAVGALPAALAAAAQVVVLPVLVVERWFLQ